MPKRENISVTPRPVIEDITFEKIDLNEDGDITKTEVDQFSSNISSRSVGPELSLPIWATVGIVILTLIMCVVSTFMRCNKSE